MQPERTALARCVGDPARFAVESWGRSPMIRRGAGSFRDLLDVDVVERLLNAAARRPSVRLAMAGAPVPVGEYTTSLRLGGVVVDDVVDSARVMQLVADGATVVLQSLQHSWPPIARFCSELQSEIGHVVQANCYLSPPHSTALARHRDSHEVIVLQVEGSKAWTVEGVGEVELGPDDVMYIPRGAFHEAAALGSLSLHVTIGVLATTYRAALRRALDGLPGAELDRPLPLGFASSRDGSEMARARLAAALGVVAREVDVDAVIDREVQRTRSRRRVVPAGHLRSVLSDRPIDDDTWIQANPRMATSVDGEGLILRVGRRQLVVPGDIGDAVAAVAGGAPVAVRALPLLDTESRSVFARRLVHESLAFVVEPPPRASPQCPDTTTDAVDREGAGSSDRFVGVRTG